jgi:hypothetical protein
MILQYRDSVVSYSSDNKTEAGRAGALQCQHCQCSGGSLSLSALQPHKKNCLIPEWIFKDRDRDETTLDVPLQDHDVYC